MNPPNSPANAEQAPKVIPIEAQDAAVEVSLYEVRKKIYPRAVTGIFATWRWILVWATQLVFYGLCWLPWNGRQAVLFHLVERKFYIFGAVFWPQDVVYLTIILILSAFGLFLFTAVAGRLWCGYACPQTVYTEIFMWIEMKIEGDRAKRMKLDQQPMSARKFGLKFSKQAAWIAVSLWTGFTFVGYFTPIRELASEVLAFTLGPWETFWVLFYGFATYGNAGYMREQVCKYMCPYARFQGVMFDPDTLVITYDTERGEPRGSRRKGVDPRSVSKGDCVDCGICVQVCPTGIDIRKGLQYECIGCAACIDGCDQVMDKMGYQRGLIRYTTENALKKHWGSKEILRHVMRPRIMLYTGLMGLVIIAFIWSLATRQPLKVNVIRDRSTLAREVEGGLMENVYRLQIINTSEQTRKFTVTVSGMPSIVLASDSEVVVDPASTRSMTVGVRAPEDAGKHGSNEIYFDVTATDDSKVHVHEKSTFLLP
ncbi:MAG: cytochrome c oxidase accessory protein CcoG [Rhodocyclaceae bacterium]|nr:cytochrome c oxidase accessory protein CcoG [Rhodocyclaceae bacterium]MBX3668319.1 cytochrome c oxidase accessory protein CcoG [Rhodocyclaceae bacterium]